MISKDLVYIGFLFFDSLALAMVRKSFKPLVLKFGLVFLSNWDEIVNAGGMTEQKKVLRREDQSNSEDAPHWPWHASPILRLPSQTPLWSHRAHQWMPAQTSLVLAQTPRSPHAPRWHLGVIAVQTAPLRKVISEVERCWRGRGIFVVNEGHGLDLHWCCRGLRAVLFCRLWLDNHVPAQQVAMAQNQSIGANSR